MPLIFENIKEYLLTLVIRESFEDTKSKNRRNLQKSSYLYKDLKELYKIRYFLGFRLLRLV